MGRMGVNNGAPQKNSRSSQLIQAPAAGGPYFLGMENISQIDSSNRSHGFLAWQLASYDASHHDRKNLRLHIVTVPVFMAGTMAAIIAPFTSLWLAPVGLFAMFAAIATQGKGHKNEKNAPAPFQGPRDVFARIFAEQWITFPRFVLSGGFAKAWRAAA